MTNDCKLCDLVTIHGKGYGYFRYGDVEREFTDELLVVVTSKGGIVVLQAPGRNNDLKPICYIEKDADIALARNMADADVEVSAIADDGREILVTLNTVFTINGIDQRKKLCIINRAETKKKGGK